MKKILLLMLTVLTLGFAAAPLSAQTIWDGTADTSWYDASESSFDISTPEELAGVAQLVNNGTTSFNGKTLNLTDDIWLNSTGDSTNNWTPIGGGSPTSESPSTGNAFKGKFNGHGHVIYNLYCDKGSTFHAGLFCALENPCTIDSLALINPVLKSRGMMGCITGFPRGSSSVYIRHCLVINARIVGENTSGSNNIGGICGATYPNSGSTYIENCGATGSITGYYPAGMAGNAERSYITNAYFAGTLFAYGTNYGGMTAHSGNRTNCYSYTEVLSTTTQSSASNDGIVVTQAKMQSDSMITLLGDAFMMDNGMNDGYPLLSYMPGITPGTVSVCQNESVTLTAHGYDSYSWSNGATSESITVTPSTTTTYTLNGTLYGNTYTSTSTVTVFPQAIINATITASSDGQVHGSVTPETATATCGTPEEVTFTVYPDDNWRVASIYMNGTQMYGEQTYGAFTFTVLSEEITSDVVINLTDELTCTHVNNLSINDLYGTNATVAWTAHNKGELSEYHIILRDVANNEETEFTTDELSYLLTDLTENTQYQVGVYTFCTDGYGSDTVYKTFMTPCNSPVNITIGEGTANTHGNYFPTQTYYNYSYTQQIIPASQLGNETQDFSSMSFQYFFSTSITRNIDIYLAHVPADANLASAWILPSEDDGITFTQVFSGEVTLNNSGTDYWFEIPFSQIFSYNGTDNILIAVLDHTGTYTSSSSNKFYTHNDENTVNMSRYQYRDGSTYDPFNPDQAGTASSNVNNIRFSFCDESSCIRPNTFTVSGVDAYSAELSWYNPNPTQIAEIEYKANSDEDWSSTGSLNGSTYTLNGLEANTVYQVRVRALCSGNEESIPTDALTFRTECEPIIDLPYTQNFDGDDVYGSGNDIYVYCWERYASNPSDPVFVYTTSAAHSSPNCLKFNDGSNITNIAIMPRVDESINLNELQVSFWLRRTENSNVVFELGVMTDKSNPATFEILDTIPASDWALVEYSLENYTGDGHYIAFRVTKGNGSDYMRLDDVMLDYIPVCAHPIDLTVDAVTAETAEFHWTQPGEASTWYVKYGPTGFDPEEDGIQETADDTSHILYGLNPNTEYDVYVWSECYGLESTTISGTFRTDCGPIMELPYSEDFETGLYNSGMYNDGTANQQRYILCWDRLASDDAHHFYVANSTTYSHSGSYYLDSHWTTDCYNVAIMPELDESFDVSQLMVNFWACRTGSAGTLEVGVMTDKNDISTFLPIDTIDLSMMNTYTYKEQFVSFASYEGDGKYIAFRVSNASSCGYYIDDVFLDYEPECSPISNLTVSEITGSSVVVSWTDGPFGTVESYTIEYSEADMDEWTTVDAIVTESPYLLGGLNFSTNYDLRVRPNCDDASQGEWVTISFHTECLVGGDFTIGEGTASNSNLPSYSLYEYSYSQQLFLASEIGTPKTIESVTLEMVANTNNRTFKIYMMNTTATSGAEWISASDAQLVFDAAQQLHTGLNTFTFSEPFEYDGESNLLLIMLDMTGSWQSGNTWRTHTAPFTASRYIYQDDTPYSTSAIPSSGYGSSTTSRNNVIFGAACDASTCAAPHLTVTEITSDGATIEWIQGYQESEWEMEYKLATDTEWIEMGIVTSMSETLTDLFPNTAYDVRMRSICDGGEYSYWENISFTTNCGALTITEEEPWAESFEINTTLVCWATPVVYTNSSGTVYPKMLLNYAQAAHSGGNSVELKGTSNMLVLPEFTNDIHDLRLSFFGTYWGTATSAVVGVITNLNDPTSFVALGDAGTPGPRGSSNGGNGLYMGPFDFNNISAESGRIAILYSGTSSSDAGWNLDDFTVQLIPSCAAPNYSSVTADNVDENSAEISFTDNDPDHSTWIIYYRASGSEEWSTENANDTVGNLLANLNPNTTYEVYVKTLCGGVPGDDQTATVTFTTTTIPAELPYITDFEDDEQNTQWALLNGTQTNKWYIGAPTDETSDVNTTIGGTNGLYISNNEGVSNTYSGSESRVYAYRDILVPDGTTELVLSFDWKAQGGSYNYEFLRIYWLDPSVVTLTAGHNPPTVDNVNYDLYGQPGAPSEHWLSQQSTWQHKEMVISANQFTGMGNGDKVYRLVFHWRNTSYNNNPPAAVDNIELRAITCATPLNVAVNNVTENGATVSWTGEADYFGVTVTSSLGTDYHTTSGNSLTLTNLATSTSYQVSVRAFCGSDSSMLSQTVSFATPCSVVNSFPYMESFEDGLGCWESIESSYSGYDWISSTTNTYYTTVPDGSRFALAKLSSSSTHTVRLLSPVFDLSSVSTPYVKFAHIQRAWSGDQDMMAVYYRASASDDWTMLAQYTDNISDWVYDSIALPSPSATYQISFVATNDWGYGVGLDAITVYNDGSGPGPVITDPTVTTENPSGVEQTVATMHATITNPSSVTITGKGFQWKPASAAEFTNQPVTGNDFTYTLNNLTPNTDYVYKAYITYNGENIYGDVVTFTTLEQPVEPCDVPTGLVASDITKNSFTVTWDANPNAIGWSLRYRPATGDWTSVTPTTNSHTLTGLTPDTQYEVQVMANCGGGNTSDWSETLNVSTLDDAIPTHLLNSIVLYPNPARDVVNVQCTMNNVQFEVTNIEVFDVYGKLITNINVIENPTTIRVSGLADGMYFVRVTTDAGAVTKTFVKQ